MEYREYRLQTGIKQKLAATNTPQQNRISEHEWASLWNMTRLFLAEAGVPKYVLQEAFRMAVYLANRVPSTPLGGKTPFSMWHDGTSAGLENLQTFDAQAFVHKERYVKKLTMNAWKGRMVGYGKY